MVYDANPAIIHTDMVLMLQIERIVTRGSLLEKENENSGFKRRDGKDIGYITIEALLLRKYFQGKLRCRTMTLSTQSLVTD